MKQEERKLCRRNAWERARRCESFLTIVLPTKLVSGRRAGPGLKMRRVVALKAEKADV